MKHFIVLDAGVFGESSLSDGVRARIRRSTLRGGEVWVSAVTLAEACRGTARTRQVESLLARHKANPTIRVRPTDEGFAKRVGQILFDSGRGSESIADAHVAALCAEADTAMVFTTDPDDIRALAPVVPGTRILTRRPD